MKSAKKLFLFNAYYDPSTYFDTECIETSKEKKIVMLTFKYNKDHNDLLQKYIQKSIDLTDPSEEDRLKKIVLFFSKQTRPIAHIPPSENLEEGLSENYEEEIEYIIGPHARFDPPREKTFDSIKIDKKLQQLCVRCYVVKKMKNDFKLTLQAEVKVLHITDSEIQKISKLIKNHMFRVSRLM
jgi:hypothetical protein